MPLAGQSLGSLATAILSGAVSILLVFYIKRRAKGFRSRYVRPSLDIGWGLMMLAMVLWLILAE